MTELQCAVCGDASLPFVYVEDALKCVCINHLNDDVKAQVTKMYNMGNPTDHEPSALPNVVKVTPVSFVTFNQLSQVQGNDAYLIYTDGTIVKLTFLASARKNVTLQLNLLQMIAKGNVETIPLFQGSQVMLVVNEDGRNAGLPYNPYASRFKRAFIKPEDHPVISYGNLVGNVLVMPVDLML